MKKTSKPLKGTCCTTSALLPLSLGEQFERLAVNGNVSFAVLQNLVGEPLNKGLFWRLKDKAHHVFKKESRNPVGPLLDWSMGYIFHESLKLMEDAHQRQYYAPFLECQMKHEDDPALKAIMRELSGVRKETCESMRREVARLEKLIAVSRKLFCLYFEGCAGHKPLARFLNDNETLVRHAFQADYEAFMKSIYGETPERMFVEAARSLFESARFEAAEQALDMARTLNPGDASIMEVLAHGRAFANLGVKKSEDQPA